MKQRCFGMLAALALALNTAIGNADTVPASPQAGARTYAQNYKDMVLAECIATAYQNESRTAIDAGSSASALRDRTYYDWDKHPYDLVTRLVEKYLARDYHNPLVDFPSRSVWSISNLQD